MIKAILRIGCRIGLHQARKEYPWGSPELCGLEWACSGCNQQRYYIVDRNSFWEHRIRVSAHTFELLRLALVPGGW